MLTLYQFPISHYCEKIRWALDYKRLPYTTVNLLPGRHVRVVKKIAATQEVPVLVHDGEVIQNSSDIITYLDKTFPDRPLTPGSPELEARALEWEHYVDENVGPQMRVYCYHYFLDRPAMVIPMLTCGQPWYNKLVFRLMFPKVHDVMRKFMRINERTAAISLIKLVRALDKLDAQLEQTPFLAGDTFSRADLAAAAFLAPFITPEKYGIDWPESYPEPMAAEVDAL